MKNAIATATYTDTWAGNLTAFLVPQKTTRRGERVTVYRWYTERGSVCDGLRCGCGPLRMLAHARRHPFFASVSLTTAAPPEAIAGEVERLTLKAESGEQWAHICALEAAYVTATGHQLPRFEGGQA